MKSADQIVKQTSCSNNKALLGIYLAFILVFSSIPGCQESTSDSVSDTDPTNAPVPQLDIPMNMLKKGDLQIAWSISRFPLGRGESIERIYYHNKKLYLIDNQATLYALDSDKGIIIWSATLSETKTYSSNPEFIDDRIVFAVGSTIKEYRVSDGREMNSLALKFSPTTTTPKFNDWYFTGGDNSRFYAVRTANGIPEWQSVQPFTPAGKVSVNNGLVYFTCSKGTDKDGQHVGGSVYASKTGVRDLIWYQSMQGDVAGVVITDDNQCLVPNTDTALYSFDPATGEMKWKYLSGGALYDIPLVTAKYIYQRVAKSSLVCLERQPNTITGSVWWDLKGGAYLLAENGPVTYVATNKGEITLMNNVSRKRMMSFFLPEFNLYAPNTEDAMLYMASRNGAVMALKPTK